MGPPSYMRSVVDRHVVMISTIRPIVTFAAETWSFEGVGYELFNDLRKKNPEEDFWSDQERWMEDQN